MSQVTASSISGDQPPGELTPSDKKRSRDRRAQRTLRERRTQELNMLKQEVAACRRYHQPHEIQRLTGLIRSLEEENKILRSHQEKIKSSLAFSKSLNNSPQSQIEPKDLHGIWRLEEHHQTPWGIVDESLASGLLTLPSTLVTTTNPQEGEISLGDIDLPLDAINGMPLDDPPRTTATKDGCHSVIPITGSPPEVAFTTQHPEALMPVTQSVNLPERFSHPLGSPDALSGDLDAVGWQHTSLSLKMLPPLVPAWMLVPPEDDTQFTVCMPALPWLLRPDLVIECPDIPSPLDLLHGTRRNFLANSIHQALRARHCLDPEVLAMGWVMYMYAKWRVSPNPRAFAKLPKCMKPVLGQLQKSHPHCLDQIMWPNLRLNIMHFCPKEKLAEVVDLLACCLKVRWKWGESILERDENDDLQIRSNFLDTFTNAWGWGLTPEFIDKHPKFLDGIDLTRILYVPA
ncbi:hypothetical protein PENFLA_c051G05505 [Penicillium flavigenum]|uniref:BZIP domain-containing protein n=1 Tax=Penicillium flavigenum TaxID=254877 RepID=A0A1V6SGY0_9EURO|nr:hypothetical protein PENFLA_c051G05505 [Penicillium flavigenum]